MKIIIILFFSVFLMADAVDNMNMSYEAVKTKHASKKNGECNIHVEINGNEDWEEKKDELNTVIEKSNKCREIVIYKSIKNVNTRKGNSSDGVDINLGAIIKKNSHIKIRTVTIIENSSIKDGYLNSASNIGNRIGTGTGNTNVNDVHMESNIQIKDSQIGSDFIQEMEVDLGGEMLKSLDKDISDIFDNNDFFRDK